MGALNPPNLTLGTPVPGSTSGTLGRTVGFVGTLLQYLHTDM